MDDIAHDGGPRREAVSQQLEDRPGVNAIRFTCYATLHDCQLSPGEISADHNGSLRDLGVESEYALDRH